VIILEEFLKPLDMTQTDFAPRSGRTPSAPNGVERVRNS